MRTNFERLCYNTVLYTSCNKCNELKKNARPRSFAKKMDFQTSTQCSYFIWVMLLPSFNIVDSIEVDIKNKKKAAHLAIHLYIDNIVSVDLVSKN